MSGVTWYRATPSAGTAAWITPADDIRKTAIGVAVAALALDPNPQNAFIRGDYPRLITVRVGPYRVMYVIDDDVITIERVDLVR